MSSVKIKHCFSLKKSAACWSQAKQTLPTFCRFLLNSFYVYFVALTAILPLHRYR